MARRSWRNSQGIRTFWRGDIRPGDRSPVILRESLGKSLGESLGESPGESGRLSLMFMNWGFHPEGIKGNIFNARAESVEEKPLFLESFQTRRCAVPASWFYEWNQKKEKIRFEAEEENCLLYLAGLWRQEEDGNHFVVLTTNANDSMRAIHDRMPLLLKKKELSDWVQKPRQTPYGLEVPEPARKLLKKVPENLRKSADYEQLDLFQLGV